jgi:hypothetical protein
MDLNDPRWKSMEGGYRPHYDPRPALETLSQDPGSAAAWDELLNELHHQGDVGHASYAALPVLVDIHCQVSRLDCASTRSPLV